jgi:hypothetical protein
MLNILAEALLLATRAQPMTRPDANRNWNPEQRMPVWQAAARTNRS